MAGAPFNLPPGMTPEQFIQAIRHTYEQEYQQHFGCTPVEAAHCMAHFREGYMMFMKNVADLFEVPAPAVPLPPPGGDTPETRYPKAAYILSFLWAIKQANEQEEAAPPEE